MFAYKGRAIWHKRRKLEGGAGNWLYVFMDQERRSEETGRYVARVQLDYGEEDRKPMDVVSETRRGYFAFVSNLDRPSEEIYLLYKERWDIEECFDYLKNDVAPEASHARNNDFLKGWAFINHVSPSEAEPPCSVPWTPPPAGFSAPLASRSTKCIRKKCSFSVKS